MPKAPASLPPQQQNALGRLCELDHSRTRYSGRAAERALVANMGIVSQARFAV